MHGASVRACFIDATAQPQPSADSAAPLGSAQHRAAQGLCSVSCSRTDQACPAQCPHQTSWLRTAQVPIADVVLAARSQEKAWTQIVPLNIMNWLLRHKEYEGVGMPHVSDKLLWHAGCRLRFACCLLGVSLERACAESSPQGP